MFTIWVRFDENPDIRPEHQDFRTWTRVTGNFWNPIIFAWAGRFARNNKYAKTAVMLCTWFPLRIYL